MDKKAIPGLAILIGSKMKGKEKDMPESEMEGEEGSDSEERTALAEEILSALKSEDAQSLASALQAFIGCCQD